MNRFQSGPKHQLMSTLYSGMVQYSIAYHLQRQALHVCACNDCAKRFNDECVHK